MQGFFSHTFSSSYWQDLDSFNLVRSPFTVFFNDFAKRNTANKMLYQNYKNERNIKGRSRSSRTTAVELLVKIVNSCQLTSSKSTLCGMYSTIHILIIFNYYLNKSEKKFKDIEKALNIQCFFKHSNYAPNLWQSGIYQR